MRNTKHSQNGTQDQPWRPQEESLRILQAMVVMATRIGKPFPEDRQRQLLADLGNYPVEAIEYAFDAWGRNAEKLPALKNLIGILNSWNIPTAKKKRDIAGCSQCQQGFIVTNPEAKKCDWIVRNCDCLTNPSLRERKVGEPLTKQEHMDLDAKIKAIAGTMSTHFANGNPRMNVQLAQARVLSTI